VKCITFRNNPIFHALVSQKPPSESSLLRGISYEGILFRELSYIRGLKGIHVTEAGASHFVVVASIKKMFPGHAKQVMNAIWGVFPTLAKFMIVVDDDVDINDPNDVQWAVATRVQPERDVTVIRGCQGLVLDQSKPVDDPYSSKMGIDATKRHEFQMVALPDEKYMKIVKEKWKEYGVE
jgi:UbiD family decarboxylase